MCNCEISDTKYLLGNDGKQWIIEIGIPNGTDGKLVRIPNLYWYGVIELQVIYKGDPVTTINARNHSRTVVKFDKQTTNAIRFQPVFRRNKLEPASHSQLTLGRGG